MDCCSANSSFNAEEQHVSIGKVQVLCYFLLFNLHLFVPTAGIGNFLFLLFCVKVSALLR